MSANNQIITPSNIRNTMTNMQFGQKIKFDGFTIRRVCGGFMYEKIGKNGVFVSITDVQSEFVPR
jgi:hypothetical protein